MTKQRKALKGELYSFGNLSINYSITISSYFAEVVFRFDQNENLELSLTPDIEPQDNPHAELEVVESINERSVAIANKNGWLAFQHDDLMNLFVTSQLVVLRIKNGTNLYMRFAEEVRNNDPESLKYL